MNRCMVILLIIFRSTHIVAQVCYSGFISNKPIDLVTNIYLNKDGNALYALKENNTPFVLQAQVTNGILTLSRKNKTGVLLDLFTIPKFDDKNKTLSGIYLDYQTKQEFPVTLTKQFELEIGDSIEYKNREIIQEESLNKKYFKLVISKKPGEFYPMVTGIKILDKKSNKVLQYFPLECELRGLHNLSIEDYNFDKHPDFSVFERQYTGPNTSQIYFLYDPKKSTFFDSKFKGTSLEFDQKEKLVYESIQCCGGRIRTSAIYKIIHNKMMMKEEHCFVWDEKKQKTIERKMKDCQ